MRYLETMLLRQYRFLLQIGIRQIGVLGSVLIVTAISATAWAGGGPENVFLVVNPKSAGSMAIANYYLQVRQIPPGNVFYLPWDPQTESVVVEGFRSLIMKPILETIRTRRLSSQIDYVIYSSDFPSRIDLKSDIDKFKNMSAAFKIIAIPGVKGGSRAPAPDEWKTAPENVKQIGVSPDCTTLGSLNSMTYLWPWVMQSSPDYLTWQCNRYLRMPIEEQKDKPSLGFRSSWQFGPAGEIVEKNGSSYMLSTMLGVTAGRGNTVGEVLKYLERSAKADGTHPRGTIYFMKNEDVRSAVRDNVFPEAVKDLEKIGIEAKIVNGTVPINRRDVQGVCMGTAVFDWKAAGSTILPGAICEHFTSYGGILTKGAGQTALTEFLRYGAAGASGTVVEPYAVWQKFPLPQIQVHYARGCTLAEAFYQSVYAPYQLLIVGDPLCRPWANIPKVEASGVKYGDVVKGTLNITPKGTVPHGGSIDRFELFVNGARAAHCKAGETLKLDTTVLPDGYQELRVVGVENSMIQSQGRTIFPIFTNNYGRKIDAKADSKRVLTTDEKLKLDVNSPGSIGVGVLHNGRMVGRIAGEKGTIEVSANELGSGKVRLQAVGIGKGDQKSHVMAAPIEVDVNLMN